MKNVMQFLGVVALLVSINACNGGGSGSAIPTISGDVKLNSIQDTLAYGMGVVMMNSLTTQFELDNPDLGLINRAMQDVKDNSTLFTQQEFDVMARNFFQAKQAQAGEAAVSQGKDFLEANATAEGVTVTTSGLQYKVLKEGTGATPSAEDRVKVHYEGRLISGKVFDSSIERGEPAAFPVNGVIAGWTEALQLMKEGDKWQLYIPSDLAYGARGAGADIGPNETLIFDVELLEVEK